MERDRGATVASQNPFAQARLMVITQLAVFEAVNAIVGEYEPYLAVPIVPAGVASPRAAAIAAAHRVLKTYFSLDTTIDTERATALALIPDGAAKTSGIAVGEAAAVAMTALRANDGSSPATFYSPTSSLIGEWQTTSSCSSLGGAFYHWKDLMPFGIESPSQFLLPAPPRVTSSKYAKHFAEVKAVGAATSESRSADREEVARLYAATSPSLVLSLAARQIAATRRRSLVENARAFALIMMGSNDSLIASFYNKYHYNLWRPETGIASGDVDGNRRTDGDANFVPFIVTV